MKTITALLAGWRGANRAPGDAGSANERKGLVVLAMHEVAARDAGRRR